MPIHFPYLPDEPYARDLQAQGACALRFLIIQITVPSSYYKLQKLVYKNVTFFVEDAVYYLHIDIDAKNITGTEIVQ